MIDLAYKTLEELQEAVTSKPKYVKDTLSNEVLAKHINSFGQSKKAISTLKGYDKNKLFKIILNGESLDEKPAKNGSSDNKGIAVSIIDGANELKKSLHNTPLTPYVKKSATDSLQNGLDKATLHNDGLSTKLGAFGGFLAIVALFIDVFIGFDQIPAKLKAFKQKKDDAQKKPTPKKEEVAKDVKDGGKQ